MDVHSAVPAVFHVWGIDENQTADATKNFRNPLDDGVGGLAGTFIREFLSPADRGEVEAMAVAMQGAIAQVDGDNYLVTQAYSLYATSGASDDYATAAASSIPRPHGCSSFTMECGHDFQPDWTEAEAVIREVSAALSRFAADVGAKVAVVHEPVV